MSEGAQNPFALDCLKSRQMRRMLGSVLDDLNADESAVLDCVAGWLQHLGVFSDAQIFFAAGELAMYVKDWLSQITSKRVARMISVNDARYLLVTDERWRNFLDLSTMEYVAQSPLPFLTSITCNFTELVRRYRDFTKSSFIEPTRGQQ